MKKRPDGYYGFERRRKWLRGGRIDISLGTKNTKEAKRRAAALDLLLERREEAVVEAVRIGRVGVDEVANAVRDEALDTLRERVREPEPEAAGTAADAAPRVDLSLSASISRVLAVQEATKSEGTADVYRSWTAALQKGFEAARPLPDLSTDELRAWLYAPRKGGRPWRPNTQSAVHMVASHLWRLAIEAELEDSERRGLTPRITRNPWARIEPADADTVRHSFLEPKEWGTVLERAAGRPRAALLALGCLVGLRITEVLYLRTGIDVQLEGRTPLIHIQAREGEWKWKPKNRNSVRTIPIPAALLAVLQEHVARGYAGDRFFLHTSRGDTPVSYTHAKLWTQESFEAAGLKYGREGEALTFHSLRHTFASWLVRKGWSTTLVAEYMGNTSKEVERTYAHLAPHDLGKLARTIDRLTSGAVESSGEADPAAE